MLLYASKALQEVIMTFIVQKNRIDGLIKTMNPKGFKTYTSQVAEEEDGRNVEVKEATKIVMMVNEVNMVMNLTFLKILEIESFISLLICVTLASVLLHFLNIP